MRSYNFRYRHGQSMPFATLAATGDADFFDTALPAWEKRTGFRYVQGTATCAITEHRKVPEPVNQWERRYDPAVPATIGP
mgnify:CR=1 FL=1